MSWLYNFIGFLEQLFHKVSVSSVLLLLFAMAVSCAIALFELQRTRTRVRDLLLAHDGQARAMAVLASRLDNMSQQMAQIQLDQAKKPGATQTPRNYAASSVIGLREEIESLRKEFR